MGEGNEFLSPFNMNSVLLQHVYSGSEYFKLLDIPRHVKYCSKYNIDYQLTVGDTLPPELGGWAKVELIRRALDNYDFVMYLDADAIIQDLNLNIQNVPLPKDSIGVVRLDGPRFSHLNVGVMYFQNGLRVQDFMDKWLSEMPGKDIWHEQTVFNELANEVVVELPAKWNSCFNNNWVENAVVNHYPGCPNYIRLEEMRKLA